MYLLTCFEVRWPVIAMISRSVQPASAIHEFRPRHTAVCDHFIELCPSKSDIVSRVDQLKPARPALGPSATHSSPVIGGIVAAPSVTSATSKDIAFPSAELELGSIIESRGEPPILSFAQ